MLIRPMNKYIVIVFIKTAPPVEFAAVFGRVEEDRSDEELLETYSPPHWPKGCFHYVQTLKEKGFTICNWHVTQQLEDFPTNAIRYLVMA